MNKQQADHICNRCNKKYSQYRSLYVHLKVKHNDLGEIKNISLRNFEFQEQTFFQTEDQLLMLLGQLSQKYAYSLETLIETNLYDPKNNAPGKNHFSSNSITNNPYDIVDQDQEIRFKIEQLQSLNFPDNIYKQIVINDVKNLYFILSQESDKWLYSDPHDSQLDFSEQFSLDHIPKMIKNLKNKKLMLKIPETAIFILWIGRFLKMDSFKGICRIILFLIQQKKEFQKQGIHSKNLWVDVENKINKDKDLNDSYQKLDLTFENDEFKRICIKFCKWMGKAVRLLDVYSNENDQ